MTVHLPADIETSLHAVIRSGRFTSVDEAMTEAARLLLRELALGRPSVPSASENGPPDPVLGCMRDDAELMDEIVADAYHHRNDENWREIQL
jgi:Arc/MetJ-type ribon-helix-helix transcriptional regulator